MWAGQLDKHEARNFTLVLNMSGHDLSTYCSDLYDPKLVIYSVVTGWGSSRYKRLINTCYEAYKRRKLPLPKPSLPFWIPTSWCSPPLPAIHSPCFAPSPHASMAHVFGGTGGPSTCVVRGASSPLGRLPVVLTILLQPLIASNVAVPLGWSLATATSLASQRDPQVRLWEL